MPNVFFVLLAGILLLYARCNKMGAEADLKNVSFRTKLAAFAKDGVKAFRSVSLRHLKLKGTVIKMNNEYFSHLIPSSVDGNDIPLGMGVAFAQNLSALTAFAAMSSEQQEELIRKAHSVKSDGEMEALVNGITGIG